MSRVFYRYIRPVKFNSKRLEFDTIANGGICFRLEENLDGTLWFTHARCPSTQHFSKDVARAMADSRANIALNDPLVKIASGSIKYDPVTENLARSILEHLRTWKPVEQGEYGWLVSYYMSIEWAGLADQLERILKQNDKQREIGGTWITAAHAMETAQHYADLVVRQDAT